MTRLLTPEQAAEILGVRRKTIYELSHQRKLDVVKLGRTLRIPEDALHRFVRARTRRAVA